MNRLNTAQLFLGCIIIGLAFQARATTPAVIVPVGNTSIAIPAPYEFADPTKISSSLRHLAEASTPPGNRLLALFIPKSDMKKIVPDEPAALTRYCVVQTVRKFESNTLSPRDFTKLKNLFRQQQHDLLERNKAKGQQAIDSGSREFQRLYDTSMSLKIGEIIPLGIFDDAQSSIGIFALMKSSLTIDGQSEEWPMAMAMAITLVKGRLVYLYVYSKYRSAADIEWARATVRDWAALMTRTN